MSSIAPEFDPEKRLVKFAGSGDPEAWPKSGSAYASIFEVVKVAGAGLFGSEWTGLEFSAVSWSESPKTEIARQELMRKLTPVTPKPKRGVSLSGGGRHNYLVAGPTKPPKVFFDAHVRARHIEIRELAWERNQSATKRLKATVEWVAQRCRDGDLTAYARLREGGVLFPMAAWEWNVDEPLGHFLCDGGHKRYFPDLSNSGPYGVLLFFERNAIKLAIGSLEHAPFLVSEADISRLSPYLRMAVRLALAKEYISAEKAETQVVREAEVRAAWREALSDVPESDRAIAAIAKVMGYPDVKAILQGQSRRKPKNG